MNHTLNTAPIPAFRLATLALLGVLAGCAGLYEEPPRRETHNQKIEAAPLPERPVGPNDHLVRKGDTVYGIAFRNQLDYREVAKWNGIGSDYLIRPGQVLHLQPPPRVQIVTGDVVSTPVELEGVSAPTPIAAPSPSPSPSPVALPPASGGNTVTPPRDVAQVSLPAPPAPAVVSFEPGGPYRWQWPTNGTVVRGYAPDQGSKGLDFTGVIGQPVVAAAPGRVVYSGSALKGYGELVIIKHDDLRLSAYGYNRKRLVSEGEVVAGGQPIAELGMGPENKPILHFEIRERGKPVSPVTYLPPKS